MARRMQSTNRLRARTLALALLLAVLAAPATALADSAATDEYSLGAVDTDTIGRDVQQIHGDRPQEAPTPGVVGETTSSDSPLEALGAIADPAVWALVALVLTVGGFVILRAQRPRTR